MNALIPEKTLGGTIDMKRQHIAFFSIVDNWQWGGSEELWGQTALRLKSDNLEVSASVATWATPHKRVLDLRDAGINVHFRPRKESLFARARRLARSDNKSPLVAQLDDLLAFQRPSLVVFSNGNTLPDVDLLETCYSRSIPFATVAQANFVDWWPADELAQRYRAVLPKAGACFFVSNANQRLAFRQIGCELPNSEVIWNPVSVSFGVAPQFPRYSEAEGLLMACVARLHPPSKGQDVLLDALATPAWSKRSWRLGLYGEGAWKGSIEQMVRHLGLSERVTFAGQCSVTDIWERNQVLVLPSRYEGLPLSIVEALLCGRPVVATDVAGNSEVIEDGQTGFLASSPTVPAVLEALERLWVRRTEVARIGRVAARRIREIFPADPIHIFASKLRMLVR